LALADLLKKIFLMSICGLY